MTIFRRIAGVCLFGLILVAYAWLFLDRGNITRWVAPGAYRAMFGAIDKLREAGRPDTFTSPEAIERGEAAYLEGSEQAAQVVAVFNEDSLRGFLMRVDLRKVAPWEHGSLGSWSTWTAWLWDYASVSGQCRIIFIIIILMSSLTPLTYVYIPKMNRDLWIGLVAVPLSLIALVGAVILVGGIIDPFFRSILSPIPILHTIYTSVVEFFLLVVSVICLPITAPVLLLDAGLGYLYHLIW